MNHALDLDRPLHRSSRSRQVRDGGEEPSLAEDHFADHFPGYPVMPAPLILEGLAQTGGILVGEANDFNEKVVLAKIPKATFHREAMAGEMLTYTTEIAEPAPPRGRP